MNEELFYDILSLFVIYNNQGKKLDIDFFKYVYERLLKTDIKEYINRIIILDSSYTGASNSIDKVIDDNPDNYDELFGLAMYDSIGKDIYIRNNRIDYSFRIAKNYFAIKKEDDLLFYNLFVLQILLHEVEHANQMYKIANGNDLESNLLRITNFPLVGSYEYSLKERLAEAKSFKYVLFLMDKIGIYSNQVYNFFETQLTKVLRQGYEFQDIDGKVTNYYEDIFISPIEKYLYNGHKSTKEIYDISESLDSDDERLLYGLPISLKNYLEIFGDIKKTRQKIYYDRYHK